MRKLFLTSIGLLTVSTSTLAGGLLTNTNQHVLLLRTLTHDASTQIGTVYSNPVGVVLMEDGFHPSLNGQSAFQTRTITSTFAPFAGFGGDATKVYKGEASALFVPSIFVVHKKDRWAFLANFAITDDGGKATFNEGLGSSESRVAMIPKLLKGRGFVAGKCFVSSFMEDKQYIFDLQLGAAYRITDYLSVFGGARINYVSDAYSEYLKNVQADIGGGDRLVNLNNYSTTLAAGTMVVAEKFEPGSPEYIRYMTDTARALAVAGETADMEPNCKQSGWEITPIIGADFRMGKWNVGMKYGFNTELNAENKTRGTLPVAPTDSTRDKFANYRDGVNTPHDILSLLTIGVSCEILSVLCTSVGYRHLFDIHAKMVTIQDPATGVLVDKHDYTGNGASEYLANMKWGICKWAWISAGIQRTRYGVKDNYQSDMSFAVSSYSYGFGVGFNIVRNLKLNVAYFWTDYDRYTKDMSSYSGMGTSGKDVFTRINKVFGAGLDHKF